LYDAPASFQIGGNSSLRALRFIRVTNDAAVTATCSYGPTEPALAAAGGSGGGGGGGGEVTNAGTFAVQVDGDALTALNTIAGDTTDIETAVETYLPTIAGDTTDIEAAIEGLDHEESTAHSSGHMGIMSLAVRQDSQADLAADGQYIPLTVTDSGGLRVSIVDGAGSGGTALNDDADFVDGTTSGTPIGGVAESAAPSTVTEGDFGWAAITLNRALKVSLFETDGDAITVATDSTFGSDTYTETSTTGPVVGGVRNDVLAALANTDNEIAPFQFDALGALWTRQLDPCSGVAKVVVPIDIVTATTTEIINGSGASTKAYICGVFLGPTSGAQNVTMVEDDTDGCGSPTAGMFGGVTAGEGWNMAANGGTNIGNGTGTVGVTAATNRYVCLITSAAQQVSGTVVYALAP
jgi:hypothetical protein